MFSSTATQARGCRRHILKAIVGLLLVVFIVIVVLGLTGEGAGSKRIPAGYKRNEARYLKMADGTRIAVDIWYPGNLEPSQRVPALLRATRYLRGAEPGFLQRVMFAVGKETGAYGEIQAINDAEYAFVIVDVRGTGASFGSRPMELSPEEIADLREVLDWVTRQPWSNGEVGAFGISYDGTTAELLASLGHPALKAVAPRFSPFDVFLQPLKPGGVQNFALLKPWSHLIQAMDANDLPRAFRQTGLKKLVLNLMARGAKPVEEDRGGKVLAQAVAEHRTADLCGDLLKVTFRDDFVGASARSVDITSPSSYGPAIERSGVPLMVWAGWLDSDYAKGALSRFLTLTNPQQVLIGPWAHGGFENADPFIPPGRPVDPSLPEQLRLLLSFFDRYLKAPDSPASVHEIRYRPLGGGQWKTTTQWPPAGFTNQNWFLAADGLLNQQPATEVLATDAYDVNFTASTGPTTRWHQLNQGVTYTNRAEADRKLLCYTSAPLGDDLEVTGSPSVSLYLESSATDGAFHVYLEDVTPEGRVIYVTEGIFRALHRKRSVDEKPYASLGAYHTFRKADAQPLVPGEVASLEFELFPTSVVFRQGHRIRLAVAGHDEGNFERIPAEGPVTWRVHRGAEHPSHLILPVQEARLRE